jgi:hypothetical protein
VCGRILAGIGGKIRRHAGRVCDRSGLLFSPRTSRPSDSPFPYSHFPISPVHRLSVSPVPPSSCPPPLVSIVFPVDTPNRQRYASARASWQYSTSCGSITSLYSLPRRPGLRAFDYRPLQWGIGSFSRSQGESPLSTCNCGRCRVHEVFPFLPGCGNGSYSLS